MVELLLNHNNCTGCTACVNVCPKNAINTVSDQLGFLYPQIEENRCIECNQCVKTCPKDKPLPYTFDEKLVKIGISKDKHTVLTSSSGGAFSEIFKYFERKK